VAVVAEAASSPSPNVVVPLSPSTPSFLANHTGGKHFSRDLVPLNADGEADNMWAVMPPLPSPTLAN